MLTKEYLSLYRKYMSDIVFYESLKENAMNNVASLKSPVLSERVQNSAKNDPIGNLVIEYERDVAKFDIEILSCKTKMLMIENQIAKIREIDDTYYKILSYRYVCGYDWKEISKKMLLSMSTVTHIHAPALKKFEEIFGEHFINA